MIVLVTGSRDLPDEYAADVFSVLNSVGVTMMINGCAKGLDSMCLKWAEDNNILVEKYPADWEKYGKAAGPIRNKQMLDRLVELGGETVLAFPYGPLYDSRGTKNAVETAIKMGLTPNVYEFPKEATEASL